MASLHSFDSVQVAVAGGGIVGKATALGLLQLGLKVALIDPKASGFPVAAKGSASGISTFPRAYALSPGSQALFERLRVWQALDRALLSPVYDMRIYGRATHASDAPVNRSGVSQQELQRREEAASLHFSAFEARVPVLAWIVEEAQLESALDAALSFQPQLRHFPTQLRQFQVNQSGAMLTLGDKTTINAELLLGADGAQSFVRSQMGVSLTRREYPQLGVIATFQIQKPHGETAYQWFDQGEILALLPLPGNQVSMVWSVSKEHGRSLLALSGPELAAMVQAKVGERFGRLDCLPPSVKDGSPVACGFPLARYSVDHLIAPHIALIGDAAHGLHPLAGQGLNLGLGDVSTMLDVVAQSQGQTFRSLGDFNVLRRYERARREDLHKLLWATEGIYRLFSVPGVLAQGVRIAGMTWLNRLSFLKRQLITQALGLKFLQRF